MAYQNNGYKRSMKIQIIKHPDNGTADTIITEDGQGVCSYNGTTYTTPSYIGDDDGFRQLSHTDINDGDWDVRLLSFKNYIQAKYSISDPGLYESTTGLQYRVPLQNISVSISDAQEGQGFVYSYTSVPVLDTLTVVAKGLDNTDITMTIVSGYTQSQTIELTEGQGSRITDLSNPTVSPTNTDNAIYSVSIVQI